VRAHVRNSRIWNFVAGQERDPGAGGGEGGLTPRIVRLGASQLVGSRCRPRSQPERAKNASTIAGNTPGVKKSGWGRLMVTGAQWGGILGSMVST
jgi:hypothetical protein